MTNMYGRQVVLALTNKSGGGVIAGDVVIVDTSNDTAFTTTTTGRSEVTVGVAQETIASNATGRVLISGYAALVNVPASVTRGHYVETHTVVKQATGNSTRRSGSMGQFLTGGTTPTAVLWGKTDQTATAGAGALILLETHTASSSASLAFTTFYSSTYDDYVVEIVDLLVASNNVGMAMHMSTDGGSTWITTNDYYSAGHGIANDGSAVNFNSNGGSSFLLGSALANTSTRAFNMTLHLRALASTSLNKHIYGHGIYTNQSFVASIGIMGLLTSTTAVTAFRVLAASGNLASGSVRVYGVAKT